MKYTELSDEAKARAREWWLDIEHETWGSDRAPDYYEDMATCLSFLGIEVDKRTVTGTYERGGTWSRDEYEFQWSGFWSQGDGLVFEGNWRAERVNLAGLEDYAPQDTVLRAICEQMVALMLKWPQAEAGITTVTHGPDLPSMELRDGQTEPWDYPALPIPVMPTEDEQVLYDLIRHAAAWCYSQLEENYESDTSDEAAEEAIEANEYEFDETGAIGLAAHA